MTEPNEAQKTENSGSNDHHTKRDAETQTVIGIFVIAMSIMVLIGTFFAVRPHAMIVNVVAGTVLLAIGIGMVVLGRKTGKRISS
jgi:hypothetical protein